jgi:hypothetical protein
MDPNASHPMNAPGDFHVEDGMCIACKAPENAAPELMAHDETDHCYFRRQPTTPSELEHATQAILVSCCGAVRHAGTDHGIIERLGNNANTCDFSVRSGRCPRIAA